MSNTCDAIVIGGGHNGLTCANYLQRAGFSTTVLERRPVVGGAVCTEEMFPGCRVDIGSSVHIMVHRSGIIEELELERFGLQYCPMDPWATFPLPDRSGRAICFYQSLERTCDSIAAVSPDDARAYKDFIQRWTPVAQGTFRAFLQPPTPLSLGRNLVLAKSPDSDNIVGLHKILTSYGRLIAESFSSPEMRAALGWLAAQSGPPPTEVGSAPFAGWHAVVHGTGTAGTGAGGTGTAGNIPAAAHPKGGSGMLSVALERALIRAGGTVRTNAPVERVLVENNQAVGVVLPGGEMLRARVVIAACHVVTLFTKLLDENDVPADLLHRVRHIHIGNGFGATVRCLSTELPDYGAGQNSEALIGMQLLCPSEQFLRDAYADYFAGIPSRRPPVLSMTFSPIDDTLAPPGQHVLSFWSQYFPYRRRDGRDWDDCADEMADSILETVYDYAPNLRGKIQDRYIQTPKELERRIGLLQGNVMHVEMSLDQMFCFRPLPEMSQYRTPIGNLFLTGASTHPGGGVFGASGKNAAAVVQNHLRKQRRRFLGFSIPR